jgi:hypothetical protein
MAVTLLIAFNTALEQDTKKKPKKIVEEPSTDLVTDQSDKNYQIYGDEEKIEEIIKDDELISEETVSITPKAPYYTLPNFDWDNKSLWINDRHAIKYWMRTYNGNQKELEKLKEDEDFKSKSY